MNINMNIQDIHYNKYIKYKTKYLELKEQLGGNCENIASIIPTQHNYEFLDNAVIVEKINGFGTTFHYKPQKKNSSISNADLRNSNLLKEIDDLLKILKEILQSLISYYNNSWDFGSKAIKKNFESILKDLIESRYIYIKFRTSINNFNYNNSKKKEYYDNYILQKNDLQLKIINIENNIQNNIKKKSLDDNSIISNNLNFLQKQYNNKDLCSLHNIIIFYFNMFKNKIESTIPLFTMQTE